MRVLLVDDHGLVRRGVRELLVDEFPDAVFEEAVTGEDAVEAVRKHAFELVILDISMPRRGGLDALKDLQLARPQLPVIVLSQHAEEQYAVRALRAGARAYLTKSGAPEELIRAAHKALTGGKYVTASLAEQLVDGLHFDSERPLHAALSDREHQVLRMLATGRAVKDIASELALSEKTVSTYRARVLEKMHMSNNAELMRYALRAGLIEE